MPIRRRCCRRCSRTGAPNSSSSPWLGGVKALRMRNSVLPRTVPAGEQQRLAGGELKVEVHEHPATSVTTTQSLGSYR